MNDFRQIISGFPGIGKTTAYNALREKGVKILDSDSSTFDKAEFPKNYLDHIQARVAEGYTVFVSSHSEVRAGLEARGMNYTVVYPYRCLKDEYLKRYLDRGSVPAFIDLMDKNWDAFVDSCETSNSAIQVKLGPHRHLSDLVLELNYVQNEKEDSV